MSQMSTEQKGQDLGTGFHMGTSHPKTLQILGKNPLPVSAPEPAASLTTLRFRWSFVLAGFLHYTHDPEKLPGNPACINHGQLLLAFSEKGTCRDWRARAGSANTLALINLRGVGLSTVDEAIKAFFFRVLYVYNGTGGRMVRAARALLLEAIVFGHVTR